MTPKLAIAIPARYGSTRFPGKPLAMIGKKTMLERVVDLAHEASEKYDDITIFVTTENMRIAEHAKDIGVACITTPASCKTGSDRVLSALRQLDQWPDFVVNLQGDAPFTPPAAIERLFDAFTQNPQCEVVTPVHRLSWRDLDSLRERKKVTPFSGTTAVIDDQGCALWFSKNILPAIRNEDDLRRESPLSPVYRHMGLYGFRPDILEQFCRLPQTRYEELEGLEQLRMLEGGIRIQTVCIEIPEGAILSGIDSPEDLKRAEDFLKAQKK